MTAWMLDHVYYWTRDMDAAVTFYTEVMGLSLVRRNGNAWAEFDTGSVRFALHGTEGEVPSSGTAAFAVEDLDSEKARLGSRGVVFHEHVGEVEGYARFASFSDPDGHPVQLIEYLGRR